MRVSEGPFGSLVLTFCINHVRATLFSYATFWVRWWRQLLSIAIHVDAPVKVLDRTFYTGVLCEEVE